MADSVVRVEDLRFRWTAADPFRLDIPRFEIATGESVFLHGPSGSGKSTLLALLAGILRPASGRIRILDQELTRLGPAARDRFRGDHIGFIFQQFNLIPYLSVVDNVLLPCRFSKRRRGRVADPGKGLHAEAERLLQRLDMASDLWKRDATALSVGQQQRVAAARALIGKPEVVIADEPTSSLDAERQVAFLELLKQECGEVGASLLFVSHDLRLATTFDRMLEVSTLSAHTASEAAS
jgi:putative ABC transport system ATP-binding protein